MVKSLKLLERPHILVVELFLTLSKLASRTTLPAHEQILEDDIDKIFPRVFFLVLQEVLFLANPYIDLLALNKNPRWSMPGSCTLRHMGRCIGIRIKNMCV